MFLALDSFSLYFDRDGSNVLRVPHINIQNIIRQRYIRSSIFDQMRLYTLLAGNFVHVPLYGLTMMCFLIFRNVVSFVYRSMLSLTVERYKSFVA
jgi:hypothetical protein